MKLESSRQVLEKYSIINFHNSPLSESWVFPCGRRDGYDKANGRFLQYSKREKNILEFTSKSHFTSNMS